MFPAATVLLSLAAGAPALEQDSDAIRAQFDGDYERR